MKYITKIIPYFLFVSSLSSLWGMEERRPAPKKIVTNQRERELLIMQEADVAACKERVRYQADLDCLFLSLDNEMSQEGKIRIGLDLENKTREANGYYQLTMSSVSEGVRNDLRAAITHNCYWMGKYFYELGNFEQVKKYSAEGLAFATPESYARRALENLKKKVSADVIIIDDEPSPQNVVTKKRKKPEPSFPTHEEIIVIEDDGIPTALTSAQEKGPDNNQNSALIAFINNQSMPLETRKDAWNALLHDIEENIMPNINTKDVLQCSYALAEAYFYRYQFRQALDIIHTMLEKRYLKPTPGFIRTCIKLRDTINRCKEEDEKHFLRCHSIFTDNFYESSQELVDIIVKEYFPSIGIMSVDSLAIIFDDISKVYERLEWHQKFDALYTVAKGCVDFPRWPQSVQEHQIFLVMRNFVATYERQHGVL